MVSVALATGIAMVEVMVTVMGGANSVTTQYHLRNTSTLERLSFMSLATFFSQLEF